MLFDFGIDPREGVAIQRPIAISVDRQVIAAAGARVLRNVAVIDRCGKRERREPWRLAEPRRIVRRKAALD